MTTLNPGDSSAELVESTTRCLRVDIQTATSHLVWSYHLFLHRPRSSRLWSSMSEKDSTNCINSTRKNTSNKNVNDWSWK